jgi:hypothetical protein
MLSEGFGFGLRLCSQGVLDRRARVQSQVERSEPRGNLGGFLARLHQSQRKQRFAVSLIPSDKKQG